MVEAHLSLLLPSPSLRSLRRLKKAWHHYTTSAAQEEKEQEEFAERERLKLVQSQKKDFHQTARGVSFIFSSPFPLRLSTHSFEADFFHLHRPAPNLQRYRAFLVLDIEGTCESGKSFDFPNEVIGELDSSLYLDSLPPSPRSR